MTVMLLSLDKILENEDGKKKSVASPHAPRLRLIYFSHSQCRNLRHFPPTLSFYILIVPQHDLLLLFLEKKKPNILKDPQDQEINSFLHVACI